MTHGSNAAVIPVVRGRDPFVLRLTPPGPAVAEQVEALRFWNGRGTVQLIDADAPVGVMLLEADRRLRAPLPLPTDHRQFSERGAVVADEAPMRRRRGVTVSAACASGVAATNPHGRIGDCELLDSPAYRSVNCPVRGVYGR